MKRLIFCLHITLCWSLLWLSAPSMAAGPNTLVVGVSSDIHTLDSGVSSDNYDWRQIYPCYDRLVKYRTIDGKGSTEVEPQAAESWTVSDDGTVWVFKIRKGIFFDDGTSLDAASVKFSFQRTLTIGKGPADNIGSIKSMRAIDAHTLEIVLKNAYGPFLQTLATDGASIINPAIMKHEKDGDLAQGWLAEHTDGSGPFRLVEWTRGQQAVLEAKATYWAGAPKIKKVVIRFMSESADRRMALERGDIDIAENILIDQIPALEKNSNIVVNRYPSQLVEYVYLNNQKSPLNNPKIRQALCYAVDYKSIIDYVLQGNGVQMRGPVPKGMWGHKSDLFQHSRDIAKAKSLLKSAGFDSGIELTLLYSDRRSSWEQIATILQSNFSDIGVTLKLQLMANPAMRDRVDKGDFELCLGAWSPDFADPFMFMNFWFDSNLWGLPGNRSFYKNDDVDAMIRKAATVTDQKERTKLYYDAQEIIMEEAPYIFLYQVQTIVPTRKNVKGYIYNPMLESMYNFENISK